MPTQELDLRSVRELYERGLFLQAYRAGPGPVEDWTGTEARLLAGRLAIMLGAPRLGTALHLRAWRSDRDDPEAIYYHISALLGRRGPWEAWLALQRVGMPEEARADLWAIRGRLLACLRDFDEAERCLDRAEALDGDSPWVSIERSWLLKQEDRYEDALEAARAALTRRPWYGPAVQMIGHLLQLLDRDDEARSILEDGLAQTENSAVAGQLILLLKELRAFPEALATLGRYEELTPLLEKEGRTWRNAVHSDLAYGAGDLDEAARLAEKVGEPFYEKIAEHIRDRDRSRKRVFLPLCFLRQHHMTCGPATLSTLASFFEAPADHLGIAAEICYGGTTEFSERRWANENGFVTREFTLNVADAEALLDAGIPFAVATVESTSAHMQAIMGYDGLRGVFFVRDPYERNWREWLAEEFLERYRSCGPRALVMVPEERRQVLERIPLSDSRLYDCCYGLQDALRKHEHRRALDIYRELADEDADHRLTIQARLALSYYERDSVAVLSCLERLLELYPGDSRLLVQKLACLKDLARRDERIRLLEELARETAVDPAFLGQLAGELNADPRESERTRRLLRRALRRAPTEAVHFFLMARLSWNEGDFEGAIQLHRFAACLAETNEQFASSYFEACRARGRTQDALALLRARFERFGQRSGGPALSLFRALESLDSRTEAFAVLDRALGACPEDGELLLHAADAHGRYGEFEKARELLERAEGTASESARLATRARLASYRGEKDRAMEHWHAVLELDPLHGEAHLNLAQLLEAVQGRAAAVAHLRATSESYGFRRDLLQLHVQWLGPEDAGEREMVLRQLLDQEPADAWGHRELAMCLATLGRLDEAEGEADEGLRLEPANPCSHGIRGHVLSLSGRLGEAIESFRESIRQSVDYDWGIVELLRVSRSEEERRASLELVRKELGEQVSAGEGLLSYQDWANRHLDSEEVLVALSEIREARPELWQAWVAWIRQLLLVERNEEAWSVAVQATERFPLHPELWLERSQVCQVRSDPDGRVTALERALTIRPGLGFAIRELSEHYRESGDLERARSLLEQAVRRDPLDMLHQGYLAEVLAELGENGPAIEHLEQALRIDPSYEWAWERLAALCRLEGTPERTSDFTRELVRLGSGQASAWLLLAKTLAGPEELDERLAALARAIELDPRGIEAWDLRATLLAEARRFDEAIEACKSFPNEGRLPSELEGRLAWIDAERGHIRGAIAQMRELVEKEPGYAWGWVQLADWFAFLDRNEEYRRAAEKLVELRGDHATAHGYLGHARMESGDPRGARESFQRALELEPDYGFARAHLFSLLLCEGDREAAKRLLSGSGQDSVLIRACRVQLAAAERDAAAASDHLLRLCLDRELDPSMLDAALSAMRLAGMDVRSTLGDALDSDQVQPVVASFWILEWAGDRAWERCFAAIHRLHDRPALLKEALSGYLNRLVELGERAQVLRLLDLARVNLRADAELWGSAGHALLAFGEQAKLIAWLSDWREREGVAPWMLLNLTLALRSTGDGEEAHAVSEHAVTLAPDHGTPLHELWLAADALLDGETELAARLLGSGRQAELSEYYRLLAGLVEAGLESCRSEDPVMAFHAARRRIRRCRIYKKRNRDRALRSLYRRVLRLIASRRGGLVAFLWEILERVR